MTVDKAGGVYTDLELQGESMALLVSERFRKTQRQYYAAYFPQRCRSVPRLVNAIANKSGGCERLPVAKERLFRAGESMGEQCHRMWSRACRNELKRRRLFGERHFFDADARLDHAREYGPKNQGGDG